MSEPGSIFSWFVENEAALSGVAATVVILGFVASPLGAGLRGLVRRWALLSPGFVETPVAAATATDIPAAPEPEADRPSIAVLPFVPASEDKDSEILADGMTDDVITLLGQVPGFFVTSRGSAFAYKGKSVDTRQVGRELAVRYVIEGSVRQANDRIRVSAQMVEVRTGEQVWSDRFEGDATDLFALQDEVTSGIVSRLHPHMMRAESQRASRGPTTDLDAWTLLHSARMKFFVGHSRDNLHESRRLAELALEKDPDYAEAHAFLVEVLGETIGIHWSDDPESDEAQGHAHARRALELEPDNALVLYGVANLNIFYTGNLDVAVDQLEQSCEINPNDAFAQGVLGMAVGMSGGGERAIEICDLAIRLSPHDPRMYVLLTVKAWVHMPLERYSEAEQIFHRSLGLYDGYYWAWLGYAITLAMQGKSDEAKAAIAEMRRISQKLGMDDVTRFCELFWGHPTGERAALMQRQIDSLSNIWPE